MCCQHNGESLVAPAILRNETFGALNSTSGLFFLPLISVGRS